MEDFKKFLAILQKIPSLAPSAVPEYRDALAIGRLLSGESVEAVVAEAGRPRRWLLQKAEEVRTSGLAGLIADLGERLRREDYRRRGIAQILLGTLTERRFEAQDIARGRPLSIEKRVMERTDTDYILNDAAGRPLFRMNIKFHGTLFRKAREIVSLEPDDCFALATYKIYGALQRQEQDRFPYLFLVLSVPGLSAATVAELIPADLVWILCALRGKRVVEEAIAHELSQPTYRSHFQDVLRRIDEGEFRVISARRAYTLMRELLFERVFGLKVPRFAQNYPRAELDMHFSISRELTPLRTLIDLLDRESPHVLAVMLDRGEL